MVLTREIGVEWSFDLWLKSYIL